MKTGTIILASAAAIAAGLVLLPRRPRVAATSAATGPRVGAGDASTVYGDFAYREQLRRELATSPEFWI